MKHLRRKVLLALASTLAALAAAGAGTLWLLWDVGCLGHPGLAFGYYGQFNRVRHILTDMPTVQVTNQWMHRDVTLEDFGFGLLVNGTSSVRLDFLENSPQMKERNPERLRASIDHVIQEARHADATGGPGAMP